MSIIALAAVVRLSQHLTLLQHTDQAAKPVNLLSVGSCPTQACLYSVVACSGSLPRLALAGFLEQICPLELTWVVRLPIHGDAVESVLQGFPGAGVHHARLQPLASVYSMKNACTLTPVLS